MSTQGITLLRSAGVRQRSLNVSEWYGRLELTGPRSPVH